MNNRKNYCQAGKELMSGRERMNVRQGKNECHREGMNDRQVVRMNE